MRRTLTNQFTARAPDTVSLSSPHNGIVKRSCVSARHQQRASSLSSLWEEVTLIPTASPTKRLPMADNMPGHNTGIASLGKRSRIQRATTVDSSRRRERVSQVLIANSDSSDSVECIPILSSSRATRADKDHSVKRPALASAPAPAPIVLDEDDEDFVQVQNRRKSQRVSYSAMFCRSGSNKDISSNSNYKRCKSNTSDCHTDDSEEDIQVVLPNTRKLLSSTSASAPSSRMRQSRKPKDMFMPSSPQLLHPSSPTIRRYNSQTSQPIVLSESTQDAAFSNTKEAVSSTVDNTLEGCTLVCSSFSRSNTARSLDRRSNNQALLALDLIKEMELSSAPTSTAPANSNIVPETPRMSPLHTPRRLSPPPDSPKLVPLPPLPQQNQQKQQKPHQLSGIPADIQRYLQTDLPSDPISEFGSPANSPSASRVSEFPNALDRGMRLCENENIDCHEDQQDSMDNGSSSLAEQPSITQWYHEGLSKYKEKEKEDDDEEDFADFTQSRSLGLDDPSQLSGDPDDYSSHMDNSGNSQSILIDDDDDDDDDDDEEVSRENGVENKDGVDDGYSSPLEGFWDLRNSGDWSTQDREMYVNQFAPSKRQVALRKRAQEKRDAMHSSLNNASSDSGGPGPQDIPIGPEATLSETATRAGRRSKGPKRVSTRKRAPRSGRSGGPKSTRGGRFAKGRKKSGIKPMSSSRARTAAATATAAAAQSSASTRRIASSTAAAAYNHYANEPVLDIAASLNWEGGGIARFG